MTATTIYVGYWNDPPGGDTLQFFLGLGVEKQDAVRPDVRMRLVQN